MSMDVTHDSFRNRSNIAHLSQELENGGPPLVYNLEGWHRQSFALPRVVANASAELVVECHVGELDVRQDARYEAANARN